MERRTRPARQRTAGSTWKASMESPPRTWLAAACTSARTLLASCRRRSLTWHHSAIATTGAITTNIPVTSFISFLLREKKKPGKGKSAVDVGKRRRLIRPALARYGSDCRRRARSCDDQATGGIAARRRRVSARRPLLRRGPRGANGARSAGTSRASGYFSIRTSGARSVFLGNEFVRIVGLAVAAALLALGQLHLGARRGLVVDAPEQMPDDFQARPPLVIRSRHVPRGPCGIGGREHLVTRP